MACASFAKLNASPSQWIGQQSFTQRNGSSTRFAGRRVSLPIRAGSYSDKLVKTAKTIASPGRGILAIDESNATCEKRLGSIGLENTEVNRQAYRQLLLTTPGLGSNNESWCQGLDGLDSRSAEYYKQGARFEKWRTVVSIPCGPSALAVKESAWELARYAAIS